MEWGRIQSAPHGAPVAAVAVAVGTAAIAVGTAAVLAIVAVADLVASSPDLLAGFASLDWAWVGRSGSLGRILQYAPSAGTRNTPHLGCTDCVIRRALYLCLFLFR